MTRRGWFCPRCGKINAPWLPQCNCKPNGSYATSKSPSDLERILAVVASHYKVTADEILGKGRTEPVVTARHIAMRLCRETLNMSTVRIGDHFNRDHTTVLYALRSVESIAIGDLVEEIQT